jgi:hypothetical protein
MSEKFKLIHSPIIIPTCEWGERDWDNYEKESLYCAIRAWKYFYGIRSGLKLDLNSSRFKSDLHEVSTLLDKHFPNNPQWNTPMPPEFIEMAKAWDVLWKEHVHKKPEPKSAENQKKKAEPTEPYTLPKLKIVGEPLSEILGEDE